MVLGPHWDPQMSLSDLIETMIQADLCKHPLYHRLLRLDAALCQLDLGFMAFVQTVRLKSKHIGSTEIRPSSVVNVAMSNINTNTDKNCD